MSAYACGPARARSRPRTQPGSNADRGRILVDSVNREAELEEITDALLLSRSDDFNALAAPELRADLGHGHVYRIAPDPDGPDLLPPTTDHDILGSEQLTLAELTRRLADGARLQRTTAEHRNEAKFRADASVLFVIGSGGGLSAATDADRPTIRSGDTVISLVPGE